VDGASEKGAIIISSGRTESMLIYQELIRDLNSRGYSVYIHDHRGQGLSGRLRKADDAQKSYVRTFDDYVADLKTFVDTIEPDKQHRKHKKLFLLAHSMGGAVATLYIETPGYENDFDAAVLVTPMHAPRMPAWAVSGASVLHLIWPTSYALGQQGYVSRTFFDTNSDLTHSRARFERIAAIYAAAASDAARHQEHDPRLGGPTHGWLDAASKAGAKAVADAKNVKIPVLILQASDDTAVSNEEQGDFCRGVPNHNCQGYLIEKSFHAVFNEADTYRVPALTTIFSFLGEVRTPQR
jgi:lysophospholipase